MKTGTPATQRTRDEHRQARLRACQALRKARRNIQISNLNSTLRDTICQQLIAIEALVFIQEKDIK